MRDLTIQELGDLQNLIEKFKENHSWATDSTTIDEINAYIEYAFEEYASQ